VVNSQSYPIDPFNPSGPPTESAIDSKSGLFQEGHEINFYIELFAQAATAGDMVAAWRMVEARATTIEHFKEPANALFSESLSHEGFGTGYTWYSDLTEAGFPFNEQSHLAMLAQTSYMSEFCRVWDMIPRDVRLMPQSILHAKEILWQCVRRYDALYLESTLHEIPEDLIDTRFIERAKEYAKHRIDSYAELKEGVQFFGLEGEELKLIKKLEDHYVATGFGFFVIEKPTPVRIINGGLVFCSLVTLNTSRYTITSHLPIRPNKFDEFIDEFEAVFYSLNLLPSDIYSAEILYGTNRGTCKYGAEFADLFASKLGIDDGTIKKHEVPLDSYSFVIDMQSGNAIEVFHPLVIDESDMRDGLSFEDWSSKM